MGFSAVVASAITLTGLLVFASLVATTALPAINAAAHLGQAILNYSSMRDDAKIDLTINSVEETKIRLYLRNLGPKTIFFKRGSYDWNTIIVSYRDEVWRTYVLDDYVILEVRISGTNYTLSDGKISCLNPGEEALIEAYLPPEAPIIPVNGTVIVVFISHYGSTAVNRGVRL